MLPRAAFIGIAREARSQGLEFSGHLPLAVTAPEASDLGQKTMEHLWGVLLACSDREDELRRLMLEEANRSGTRSSQLRPHTVFARDLVESYDEQKAAKVFSSFVKNRTWHTPTLAVLHILWYIDARPAAGGVIRRLPGNRRSGLAEPIVLDHPAS